MDYSVTCPWCAAPRTTDLACPRCGADYAKAEAIRAHGRATPAAIAPAEVAPNMHFDRALPVHAQAAHEWHAVSDPQLEYRFCLLALPVALIGALLFHAMGLGASLQRIFFTMPVHEFGHAVTAWLCGYSAMPTLWKTLIPDTRSFVAPLLLAGATSYAMFRAWQTRASTVVGACAALLALQFLGTIVLKPASAQMLITFGGDGAGMILATALMASFFFGKRTQLYKGALRWGFLVIGAAAFVDMFATWWKSRRDIGAIPYGTMDGMASDAMKLVEIHGWSLPKLVSRHVTLGLGCLVVLALLYAWGVMRAKAARDAQLLADKREEWAGRRPGA